MLTSSSMNWFFNEQPIIHIVSCRDNILVAFLSLSVGGLLPEESGRKWDARGLMEKRGGEEKNGREKGRER